MKVRVWNDNVHPFSQKIKDVVYKIPAKQCIEIDQEEANHLVKSYSPIEVDFDGRQTERSYKKLRIDEKDLAKIRMKNEAKNKSGSYICQACGYIASNKYELNGHIMAEHKNQFEDSDEAVAEIEQETKAKKKA